MVKFKKTIEIKKRKVDFIVDNKLSETLNLVTIEACEEILDQPLFTFIPHLRINIIGKLELEMRAYSFMRGLASRYGSVANVDEKEIVANHISSLNLNLDVALSPILARNIKTLTQEYLSKLDDFNIPADEKAMFVNLIKKSLIHEATHIVNILSGSFVSLQAASSKRLAMVISKYILIKNEGERRLLKKLREVRPYASGSNKREFVEGIIRNTRISLKMFVDLLLVEGIARYSEKQTEYPFDIQFIKKQYSQLVTLVDTIQDYFKLLRVISKEYSEILIGNKSNSQLPELTEKQIQEFEEDSEEMFANIKAYVYHIGPHMIHVTLFGNDDLSIPQLMRLNRFEFITAYEKGCSHIGIKPLVSLTSGNGIFDYKQALQRLHKAAKYMEKL